MNGNQEHGPLNDALENGFYRGSPGSETKDSVKRSPSEHSLDNAVKLKASLSTKFLSKGMPVTFKVRCVVWCRTIWWWAPLLPSSDTVCVAAIAHGLWCKRAGAISLDWSYIDAGCKVYSSEQSE